MQAVKTGETDWMACIRSQRNHTGGIGNRTPDRSDR